METPQEYYVRHSSMTAPGARAVEFHALPEDVEALCKIVQGVLLHRDMARGLYGMVLSERQREAAHLRPITTMLAGIHDLDARPLTSVREPASRLPVVCRHFALMLTAILRELGIPSRARCGFAAYLTPGKFEDHWVCEYWNPTQNRWILVDAQLDAVQRKAFKITFDPLDVPRDRFIIGGDAWQQCRAGHADPNDFGLSHTPGLAGSWFIAGNIVRDLAALNGMELLPWDVWGLMTANDAALSAETRAFLDHLASLTFAVDASFRELCSIYEADDRLRVPLIVFNALRNTPETMTRSSKE